MARDRFGTARAAALVVLGYMAGQGARCAASDGQPGATLQGPAALVAAPDGSMIYVACADAHQVVWVERPSGRVVRRVSMPEPPTGLALVPDGSRLVVSCAAPQSCVAVLETSSGQLVATIPAGHTAMAPVVSPDGQRLYVCNRFDNDISVIDLGAAKELRRVGAVREPIAAAITPDGRTLLVGNHLPLARTDAAFEGNAAAVVTVVDTPSLSTAAIELPHGSNGVRGLCISPDGQFALVTHLLSNFQKVPFRVDMGWINVNVVSILDIQNRTFVRTIGLDEQDLGAGNPWAVTLAAGGSLVCVALAGTHQVAVLELATLLGPAARTMTPMMGVWPIYVSLGTSLWRRIDLPGKGPRALAGIGPTLYAAEYFSDSLSVVDVGSARGQCVGRIALGPAPSLTVQRLGELLFHDATICYQHWQSCASCHPDGRADGLSWDLQNDGAGNAKSTKSMVWSHRTPPAMAEGVRMSAEEAVRSGIQHVLFADRPEEEAAAIDVYLKALQPVPSPYLVHGQLSAAAQRGKKLFFHPRVGCARCHPAPLYTDLKSHNVGSRSPLEYTEAFDTPTLIEVWRTAPYLHDGRFTTVQELLIEGKHGLGETKAQSLSAQELADLADFVLSL